MKFGRGVNSIALEQQYKWSGPGHVTNRTTHGAVNFKLCGDPDGENGLAQIRYAVSNVVVTSS